MNLGLLTDNMGVARRDADAFLNNNAISPTTQTILVAALAQLGNIPGQAELIRQAATSQDEHDAIAFQQSVQLMANLNNSSPIPASPISTASPFARITMAQWSSQFSGITQDGRRWPRASINALKGWKFASPVSGYAIILTGVVSPETAQALPRADVKITTKALPGPLQ